MSKKKLYVNRSNDPNNLDFVEKETSQEEEIFLELRNLGYVPAIEIKTDNAYGITPAGVWVNSLQLRRATFCINLREDELYDDKLKLGRDAYKVSIWSGEMELCTITDDIISTAMKMAEVYVTFFVDSTI